MDLDLETPGGEMAGSDRRRPHGIEIGRYGSLSRSRPGGMGHKDLVADDEGDLHQHHRQRGKEREAERELDRRLPAVLVAPSGHVT